MFFQYPFEEEFLTSTVFKRLPSLILFDRNLFLFPELFPPSSLFPRSRLKTILPSRSNPSFRILPLFNRHFLWFSTSTTFFLFRPNPPLVSFSSSTHSPFIFPLQPPSSSFMFSLFLDILFFFQSHSLHFSTSLLPPLPFCSSS